MKVPPTAAAKVIRTHGIKGELIVKFPSNPPPNPGYIRVDGSNYRIISYRPKNNNEVIIGLEGITSPEAAATLRHKHAETESGNFLDFDRITGYSVEDAGHAMLGIVTDLFEMPMQRLVQVDYRGKEVLIPLTDETLIDIDHSSRLIRIRIPDGLLDL